MCEAWRLPVVTRGGPVRRMTGRPFVRSLSSSARCAASLRLDAAGLALLGTWNKMEKGFQFFFKKNW